MKKFELDLRSPAFEKYNKDVDAAIKHLLNEVYAGKFAGGDINVKISIDLMDDFEEFPLKVGSVETGTSTYAYKRPEIDHKITITLKKRAEMKGSYKEKGMELLKDGEQFILSEVTQAQLSLDDMEEPT